MATEQLGRVGAIATQTFRGALSGRRVVALGLIGAIYPVVVLALASASTAGANLVGEGETVFTGLFLTILTIVVTLVLGASQFRTEIEEDTLVYLTSRSVPRPSIVVGKYAGAILAASVILVPSALAGTALSVALNTAPSVSTLGLYPAVLVMTLGAIFAYSALFLLFGLVTRQALPIGLLYGFLWEELVALLPGPIQQATIVYYLRAVGASYVAHGPLSSPVAISPAYLALGEFGFVVACLLLASGLLEWVEFRPVPSPQ